MGFQLLSKYSIVKINVTTIIWAEWFKYDNIVIALYIILLRYSYFRRFAENFLLIASI